MKDILSSAQNIMELNTIKDNFEIDFLFHTKRINHLNTINEINNSGFVMLINLFEGLINELMESKEGGKFINKFTKTIKKDSVLRDKFIFIKEVLDKQDIYVVNEGFSLINTINKVEYNKSLDKLRGIVIEAVNYLNKDVVLSEAISKLSQAVDFKMTTKKTVKNINEHVVNENIIKDFYAVKSDELTITPENINFNIVNSLLDNNLSSEECFKIKVNECVSQIENMGDDIDEELLIIKNKLIIKEYNETTFDSDMEHLISLSEIIK